jgi:hypothetical protein
METIMAVESHPLYKKWSKAFDHLQEAERRYAAVKTNKRLPKVLIRLTKAARDKARAEYDQICDQLD